MKLQKYENLTTDKNFQRLEAKSMEANWNDLSTDQNYLPEIYLSISKGDAHHLCLCEILKLSVIFVGSKRQTGFYASIYQNYILLRSCFR